MITRRTVLIAAAATVASKAAVPWVSASKIASASNLMAIRGGPMPIERNYYGFIDRLQINGCYYSGKLRGEPLLRLINEGVLRHIPTRQLAYDLARWGTAELTPSARKERTEFLWSEHARRYNLPICQLDKTKGGVSDGGASKRLTDEPDVASVVKRTYTS